MSSKKQGFLPYMVVIIVAVVIIAIANAVVVYNNNQASISRDNQMFQSQQQMISSLANATVRDTNILSQIYKGDSKADIVAKNVDQQLQELILYQGAIIYQLNTLVDSHNQMIKAIEETAGVHTPTVHNTIIHNSYCSIYVEKPSCHKKIK